MTSSLRRGRASRSTRPSRALPSQRSGRLPWFADRTRQIALSAGVGDSFEVDAVVLTDPGAQGALSAVEEARAALRAERLGRLQGLGRNSRGFGGQHRLGLRSRKRGGGGARHYGPSDVI